jgi:hypothetical protein
VLRARTPRSGSAPNSGPRSARVSVATLLAEELQPVANPAFDPNGSLYVTFSGGRGEKVPASLFRIEPDGELNPIANEILNPTGLAWGPDDCLYVSSREEGSVYRIPRNREYYYGGYKYYSAYGSNKHYYSTGETKPVPESTAATSILESLPKSAEAPLQTPARDTSVQYFPPAALPIHKPIQLNLERPGTHVKPFIDEGEENDEHPSVEKLFADLLAPPPQSPPNHRNNGHS